MDKPALFKWIKVAGLLSVIPLVLASGPLAGYIAGYYLIRLFNFPSYTTIICAIIGLTAGIIEAARMIKAASKAGNGE